jgi:hypothetical protein
MTALMWASKCGHMATVKALEGAGADLNLQDKVSDDAQRVEQIGTVNQICLQLFDLFSLLVTRNLVSLDSTLVL